MLSRNIKYIYPDIVFGPNSPVQLVDDNDGRGMRIAAWGDPRPQPTAAEIEAAALAAEAAAITEAIKAHRDALRVAGCPLGGGIVIHSDDTSRIQQIGLVMLGNNIPPGLQWKTVGGQFVEMTPTLAQQIFGAQAMRDTAIFAHAETLITQVIAAADPSTVDIMAGWPA